jgi:hypothetical protein
MIGTADDSYYREIAGRFLARRGAPLFLSAKDLDLIAKWRTAGIPLGVVLEGIDRAFERRRAGRTGIGPVLALSFCSADVLRGFERVRDRRVGADRAGPARPERRAAIRAAAEAFLSRVPSALSALTGLYREAIAKMDGFCLTDEEAEEYDAKVDEIILASAGAEEREDALGVVRDEHPRLRAAEASRAADVRIVKQRREANRIPYLAVYYY